MMEVEMEARSDCGSMHSEEPLTYTIETVDNQIILQEGESLSRRFFIFGSKNRQISFYRIESLLKTPQEVIIDSVVNAIHCSLPVLVKIQHRLVKQRKVPSYRKNSYRYIQRR